VIARLRAWRPVLALLSGLALALAFPNYNVPLVGWLSAAGLIFAVLGASLREAALCGFAYGVAFYAFSIPWIYTVMRHYGPLPVWQAAGVLALLVIQQSLVNMAFSVPVAWIARRNIDGRGIDGALVAAPFLWVAAELLRSRLGPFSFPWDLLGYVAAHNLALAQVASATGVYGLSFLVAAYGALLVWFLRAMFAQRVPAAPPHRQPVQASRLHPYPQRSVATAAWLGVTAALLVVELFGPHWVPQAHASAVAHLVQTNLPMLAEYPADWDAQHSGDMAQIEALSISAGAAGSAGEKGPSLIVWPEVPAPFSMQRANFVQRAERIARESGSDFLVGVIDWKPAPNVAGKSGPDAHGVVAVAPYNSVALLDPAGREKFLYDKIRLVPFSEYVPGRNFWWLARDLTALASDFQKGTRYAVGDLPGGRFGVFICYEAIFPDEVRRFVRNGAELLINISDDGWLGRSSGPAQSLLMARLRAVENRRWLLRDTNNGFTASVDPYGRVVAGMAPDVRGELAAPYGFRSDLTWYTRWGDWFAWLSLAIGGVLLANQVGRAASRAPEQSSRGK
jgi:apolipoprotein N-acyltransferase